MRFSYEVEACGETSGRSAQRAVMLPGFCKIFRKRKSK